MSSNVGAALDTWTSLSTRLLRWSFSKHLVAVGLALSLFIALGSLTWPLGRDQANFVWVGKVILEGGVPYRDAWDVKGPLTYYAHALTVGILGLRAISVRIPDFLAVLLCVVLLRRVVLRITAGDAFGANGAVVFFAFLYYANGFWNTAQADGWGGMLVLGALVLLLGAPFQPAWTMAAAGGLIATAALLKPTFLMFVGLPFLDSFSRSVSRKERIECLLSCLFGFLLPIGIALLLLYLGGGLRDFADLLRFIYTSYTPQRKVGSELSILWLMVNYLGLLIPLLLTPLGVVVLYREYRRVASIVTAWVVLTLLLVFVQGRYWGYHWIPAEIAMAVLVGVMFSWLRRQEDLPVSTTLRPKVLVPLICLSMLALSGAKALLETYRWPAYLFRLESRRQYVTEVTAPWDYWIYEKLAAYVAAHSGPNDKVLLWGWDALVNVLSERKTPTRFGYSYPLVLRGPLRARYREIFLNEISATPPRYIVLDVSDPWALTNKSGLELVKEFAEFDHFIHRRYQLVSKMGTFQIWSLIG